MKKCPNCGHYNEDNAKFCSQCGNSTRQIFIKILIWIGVSIWIIFLTLYFTGFFKKNQEESIESFVSKHVETPSEPARQVESNLQGKVLLKLDGSNTIGANLAPMLAKSYMERKLNAQGVRIIKLDKDGLDIKVAGATGNDSLFILISSHGTTTAFDNLKNGNADIGMSSMQIRENEMTATINVSRKSEHIIAMDGIAIIVNEEGNALNEISLSDVAKIFGGWTTNWANLGGRNSPIEVYARDEKSGTWEFFNENILKKHNKQLVNSAKRFESTKELSKQVSADVNGIGFVSATQVGNAKVLKVYENGTTPLLPTPFTIGTEDYLISRRLYFYTAINSSNQYVNDFVEYCLGNEGQDVVRGTGFISLNVITESNVRLSNDATKEYRAIVQGMGAVRLSMNIRFKSGSNEMDNKAFRDIKRISDFLLRPENQTKRVFLCGFADNVGSPEANKRLSLERAKAVQRELKSVGLNTNVFGFGVIGAVGDNSSEQGREKNRRVEIWIQ